MFTAKEPCPHHQYNDILGRLIGFSDQINDMSWHSCRVTASKILCMYSIALSQNHFNITLQSYSMDDILYNLLSFSLSWTMMLQVQN